MMDSLLPSSDPGLYLSPRECVYPLTSLVSCWHSRSWRKYEGKRLTSHLSTRLQSNVHPLIQRYVDHDPTTKEYARHARITAGRKTGEKSRYLGFERWAINCFFETFETPPFHPHPEPSITLSFSTQGHYRHRMIPSPPCHAR